MPIYLRRFYIKKLEETKKAERAANDKAAKDIFGLVNRSRTMAVNGDGINLKKIQIRLWPFNENLLGKYNIRSGGVPIAIPDAKKVINNVIEDCKKKPTVGVSTSF